MVLAPRRRDYDAPHMNTLPLVVPLATGFEEIEAVTIVDVLRRAGLEVVTASLDELVVQGSHGITLVADRKLADLSPEDCGGMVLPGGMPGSRSLAQHELVQSWLRILARRGVLTAAICAAPLALTAAGISRDRRITSYPSVQSQLEFGEYSQESVVVDGSVITSRGVGTALEFALAIVRHFRGEATELEQRAKMLVSSPSSSSRGSR